METVRYPHLQLTDWPFRIEPDESFCRFMADREHVRQDVEKLLQNLSRRTPSSILLMWAWFGAGKTHTLRYLEYVSRERFDCFLPVYTDFPRAAKGFLDLYRLTISRLDFDVVKVAFEEIYTHKEGGEFVRKLQISFPDLALTLKKLLGAPEAEQDICIRWLRGETIDKRTLKSVGINKPISSSDDAIAVISCFIQLLNHASKLSGRTGIRLIWILDEYQRVKDCRQNVRDEMNAAIHSVITRSPNYLTIIISFSGHPQEKKWPEWLSPEIRDRIGGIANVFLLPPLGPSEAVQFVRDVLVFSRPKDMNDKDSLFPFTEESVNEILKVMRQKKVELKPRAIMQFFMTVLEEADPKVEKREIEVITPKFVGEILKSYVYRETEK